MAKNGQNRPKQAEICQSFAFSVLISTPERFIHSKNYSPVLFRLRESIWFTLKWSLFKPSWPSSHIFFYHLITFYFSFFPIILFHLPRKKRSHQQEQFHLTHLVSASAILAFLSTDSKSTPCKELNVRV